MDFSQVCPSWQILLSNHDVELFCSVVVVKSVKQIAALNCEDNDVIINLLIHQRKYQILSHSVKSPSRPL